MQKVKMLVAGHQALVDEDMAKFMLRKQKLVLKVMEIRALGSTQVHLDMTNEIMGKIIRLNKRIRKNVIFLE